MPSDDSDTIKYNVSEERINESVRKMLKVKYNYLYKKIIDSFYLGSKEHKNIINQTS